MDKDILNKGADNMRILSAAMVEKAKSGHPGGAMGGADFVHALYADFLKFDPSDMSWINRDRFFLDPGHMSPMLYSILALVGTFTLDDLANFRQWGSPTPGHPELDVKKGVENTSGPLGQGHAMAVGAAITERFLVERFGEWMAHKTYAFISDGGIQEEISQGAGRIAGYLGLGNLIMFYDSNDIQLSTETNAVTTEDTGAKYKAWGWEVVTIDGNDVAQVHDALSRANAQNEKPFLIIGKTVMGKGAVAEDGSSYERQCSTHGMPLTNAGASFAKSIENLGGDPENPFVIFDEIEAYWKEVRSRKIKEAAAEKRAQEAWATANPELAAKLKKFLSVEPPVLNYEEIVQKEHTATRGASATVLSYFADKVENMIVASADLSNSDKTDGFLKKTTQFKKGDFSGAFLQAGVCELTMAAVANGMALHGGVIPVCGTFFVFSDYMKPAVRLAALMKLPVKYVWTHDAFRVGEDGPTHQPIEQEAQIRLLEKLKNHDGKNSMLVLRPADAVETTICWKLALENTESPAALLLSRQNIADVPAKPGSTRYQDALESAKGAYIAKEADGEADVVLIANGSEVATLLDGAAKLESEKGFNIRVVSAPSEGLFRDQDMSYQESIIPSEKPAFGMTAGLPVTLQGLVGGKGKVIGMEHFGYSAPYKVLDEKFGYTADNVFEQVLSYLEDYN
ncbi:MAG: transketolase [Cytophagales bacterium]|nr:transketolase [Cytophagales bacterium]